MNKIALIQELSGVANSIFGKISFRDFFYFLPAFCMIINALLTRGTFKYSIMKRVAGLILLCISFILISNSFSVIPSDSHWASDMKYNYDNLSNKNKAVQDFGTMTYIHLDTVKTAKKFFKKTDSEAVQAIKDFSDEYFTELSSNEMSSVFEGKNLILIQCESLANLAVNETVMPTVSKMEQKGISFTNFYALIYQSATADTEFISQTSLIPSIDGAPTAYAYQNNHYTGSLASLFNEKGYISNSFHSYYRVFYNREQLHESMGFSAFYDKDMLGITFPEGYEDGINWPSDEELMWRIMKKIDTEPFYHFVVTASGHMPYVDYRPEYEADYYRLSQILTDIDDEMLSYYASQSLLTEAFKHCLRYLKKRIC